MICRHCGQFIDKGIVRGDKAVPCPYCGTKIIAGIHGRSSFGFFSAASQKNERNDYKPDDQVPHEAEVPRSAPDKSELSGGLKQVPANTEKGKAKKTILPIKAKILIILLSVLLVAAIGVILFFMVSGNQDNPSNTTEPADISEQNQDAGGNKPEAIPIDAYSFVTDTPEEPAGETAEMPPRSTDETTPFVSPLPTSATEEITAVSNEPEQTDPAPDLYNNADNSETDNTDSPAPTPDETLRPSDTPEPAAAVTETITAAPSPAGTEAVTEPVMETGVETETVSEKDDSDTAGEMDDQDTSDLAAGNEDGEDNDKTAAEDDSELQFPVYARTTQKKVNVRVRTDKNSKRAAYIVNKGELTKVIGRKTDASGTVWYKVQLGTGETGFVDSSLMVIQSEEEVNRFPYTAKTKVKKVNLRKEADRSSKRITYIQKKGTTVTVLDEVYGNDNKLWYKVRLNDGDTGFARADYFEIISTK